MSSKGRFAVGAVVGAVAGVIAGLLTAPRSGKESRADLKDKTKELKRGARKKMGKLQTKGKDVVKATAEQLDKKR